MTRQKLDVRSRYKPLPENPIKGISILVQWYLVYRFSCDTTFQSRVGISVDRENRRMPLLDKLQSLGRSFLRMTLKFPNLHPLKAYLGHNTMNALPTEILEMVAGNIEDVEFFKATDTWTPGRGILNSRVPRTYGLPNESAIPLCQTCLGYHPRRSCLRPSRCRKCGRNGHDTETCQRPEQCANCFGPHASGVSYCPARPKRTQEGDFQLPTQANRKAIRDLGERKF